MLNPGDIVTTNFLGANGVKRRPAVVVSSRLYHQHCPDVILAVLTTNLAAAVTPLDYLLQDWAAAGLHQPSAFRAYFNVQITAGLRAVGQVSSRDWQGIQACLNLAMAVH